LSPEKQLTETRRTGKRIAKMQSKLKTEVDLHKLFSQLEHNPALDLGDDCAEILRTAWDTVRNRDEKFTETHVVRLCAAFRSIGKPHG